MRTKRILGAAVFIAALFYLAWYSAAYTAETEYVYEREVCFTDEKVDRLLEEGRMWGVPAGRCSDTGSNCTLRPQYSHEGRVKGTYTATCRYEEE